MKNSEKFWDKKAEGYAKSVISDEDTYQRKLSETQGVLSSDMAILEFGCGTGATAVHHAPFVKHIVAIDISKNMLEIGRGRAREAGIENIDFIQGTLNQLNAESSSLDAVLGLNVIHLLPDRKALLAEVARILKPGGIFVSSTACLGSSYLRFIKFIAPLGRVLGVMPDVFVMTESELVRELEDESFIIERQWNHGFQDSGVFLIARKHSVRGS